MGAIISEDKPPESAEGEVVSELGSYALGYLRSLECRLQQCNGVSHEYMDDANEHHGSHSCAVVHDIEDDDHYESCSEISPLRVKRDAVLLRLITSFPQVQWRWQAR